MSLDTPLDLLVDDSCVLYPLLSAVNNNLVRPDLAASVLNHAKAAFDHFEHFYHPDERSYHIPYGIDFWADGLWAPYNWQNEWGLVLLELYKATGDSRYSLRARELAERFKSEWEYNPDGRVLWHYWPRDYYNGWSAENRISRNTPTRQPSSDSFYEDLSHAGLNLKFMLEVRKLFGKSLVPDSDIAGIEACIEEFTIGNTFSRFLGGDVSYQKPSYRFLPLYGWSALNNSRLRNFYCKFIPKIYPDFDSSSDLVAYTDSISDKMNAARLVVETVTYDSTDMSEKERTSRTHVGMDILKLFGLN